MIIDHYKEEIIYMIKITCQVLANSGFRLSLPIAMPGDSGSMVFASLSSIFIPPPFYETVITTVSTTSKKIAIDFTRCISSSTIQRWPGMRWGRIQEESIFVLSLLLLQQLLLPIWGEGAHTGLCRDGREGRALHIPGAFCHLLLEFFTLPCTITGPAVATILSYANPCE